MQKLLDILLYPAKLFERLNDKRTTLYVGIILIGFIDLFSPDFLETYNILFTGKPAGDIRFNVLMTGLMVLALGLIDVIFYSFPLYDIFKYLKKKEGLPHEASAVKVMKIYIMSHFLFVPVYVALHLLVFSNVDDKSSQFLINLYIACFFIIRIWASAIVTRGINTLFKFNPLFRRLTFIIVFTWQFLLGMVFQYQIMNRLMHLFR